VPTLANAVKVFRAAIASVFRGANGELNFAFEYGTPLPVADLYPERALELVSRSQTWCRPYRMLTLAGATAQSMECMSSFYWGPARHPEPISHYTRRSRATRSTHSKRSSAHLRERPNSIRFTPHPIIGSI
jgi:hypothetical protein